MSKRGRPKSLFPKLLQQRNDLAKHELTEPVYIALSELDFSWFPREIEQVKELWNEGVPVPKISEVVGRDQDEVAILIMDLARENKISTRPGGALGRGADEQDSI